MERAIPLQSGFNFKSFIVLIGFIGLAYIGGNYMINDMSFGCNHKYKEIINPNFGIKTTFKKIKTCQVCGNTEESRATVNEYAKFLKFNK